MLLAPIFAKCLYACDIKLVHYALAGLANLSTGPDSRQELLSATPSLVEGVIKHVRGNYAGLGFDTAVRVLAHLVCGDEATTNRMLYYGTDKCLIDLLTHIDPSVRREACWGLSNIMAGTPQQIEMALSNGALPGIIQLANSRADRLDTRKEGFWCVANAISGSEGEQMHEIVATPGAVRTLSACFEHEPNLTVRAESAVYNLCAWAETKLRSVDITNPFVEYFRNPHFSDLASNIQDVNSEFCYFHTSYNASESWDVGLMDDW